MLVSPEAQATWPLPHSGDDLADADLYAQLARRCSSSPAQRGPTTTGIAALPALDRNSSPPDGNVVSLHPKFKTQQNH